MTEKKEESSTNYSLYTLNLVAAGEQLRMAGAVSAAIALVLHTSTLGLEVLPDGVVSQSIGALEDLLDRVAAAYDMERPRRK